jgi:hypothetical protein
MMHDGGSGERCGGREMRQHDGLIMRQGRVGINAGNAINAGEGRNTTESKRLQRKLQERARERDVWSE